MEINPSVDTYIFYLYGPLLLTINQYTDMYELMHFQMSGKIISQSTLFIAIFVTIRLLRYSAYLKHMVCCILKRTIFL
jgi:hypothetical protein